MSDVPLATYRLQLTRDFGFDAAAQVAPYLARLGISHLYISPILKARAGSAHGYDVVEHGELNPELGGEDAFARLHATLRKAGMGLIVDFVPNHMAIGGADNPWWLDVLEWGLLSPHAGAFDIEWAELRHRRRAGVLLPILGKPYGETLEAGEVVLKYEARNGSFSAWYYEHRLPITPAHYGQILRRVVAAADAQHDPPGRKLLELASLCQGAQPLSREAAAELKDRLAAVSGGGAIIERGLSAYRAGPQSVEATRALHRLLERQHYRLAHWRLSATEINYRRFFDINELAGLRIEDEATFDSVHALVGRLVREGSVQGLRLDHIDGLSDPEQYCERLQRLLGGSERAQFYVVVEKVLAEHERLPRFPGVSGTTGYEWLNMISRVLLDGSGLDTLDQCWKAASGEHRPFEEILRNAKLFVLDNILASEFTMLVRLLARIAAGAPATRDFPEALLHQVLKTFIVEFPVYRTYVWAKQVSADDRSVIEGAIARAQKQFRDADTVFRFLREAVTLDLIRKRGARYSKRRVERFAQKLQQLTGPVMAKSLEDTALYRFHRLIALNEVGGRPDYRELSLHDFHALAADRQARWPHGLTATDTHDTKRGEDARMRILALSELADEWRENVCTWREQNARFIESSHAGPIPAPAHEYMLYQALTGAWPLDGITKSFVERMQAYAVKAAREGKERTNWISPDEQYEAGLQRFVGCMLDRAGAAPFLDAFEPFARRIALLGALNSLSQTALKILLPGIPDFYQGSELWNYSFVDPDNRRPVDFSARTAAFDSVLAVRDWRELVGAWPDGRIKFALMHRLLQLRRELPHVFVQGGYEPLAVSGRDTRHVMAFARFSGSYAVIAVVARWFANMTDGGRYWPRAADWDGVLSLTGYSAIEENGTARGHADLSLAHLFNPVPVAIVRAVRHVV